jgi:hypothetical protein
MKRVLYLVGAIVALCGYRANANVTYNFEAGQTSYLTSPGQPVQIPIYLKETLSNGSTSQITADGGLFSFGTTVALNSGGGQINAFDRNPAFDQRDNGSTTSFPTSSVKLWAEQNANFPNGPVPDVTTGRILLATLTFQAPASGSASLSIGDFNGATTETLTYAFHELDATIAPGSFTVAVPEPISLALAAPFVAILLRRRRSTHT